VLDLDEAPTHLHLKARQAFVDVDGTSQPAPAPRFSRTPSEVVRSSPYPGEGGAQALRDWGFTDEEIAGLSVTGPSAAPGD
jgi:alpha-methylacyl-CoA racemase